MPAWRMYLSGTQPLRDQLRTRVDPAPCLDGVPPAEWWRLVNGRVYFFVREADAGKLVESYLRRGHSQEVLKLRTTAPLGDLTRGGDHHSGRGSSARSLVTALVRVRVDASGSDKDGGAALLAHHLVVGGPVVVGSACCAKDLAE